MRLETRAIHAGTTVDPATGAATPPIQLSVTFERDADGGYSRGYLYGRNSNPNRAALERCVADLEEGEDAAAFASGTAAIMGVIQALSPGDHLIARTDVYQGTARLLRELVMPWGIEVSFVDMTDPGVVVRAVRPRTRLVWVETPSNPLLAVAAIAAIARVAHDAGALRACDNTFATPVLQRPFALDADLVMHSTTKYLSGHSDVTGGVIVARRREGFLTMFGGMRGGREEAMVVAARVRIITRATSLGGVESLIEHRASIEQPGTKTPQNLLRLSVGLEHPDDLVEDLAQALA
jgi:cystathionine gamma-synthase